MTVQSWRGIALGAFIALVMPVSFLIVALLIQEGFVRVDRDSWDPSVMSTITTIALTEILLGPVGIAIAGRAAGLRHPVAWLLVIVLGLPALAIVWFLCVATLSGALGSPF